MESTVPRNIGSSARKSAKDSREGSVLMETILVIPILLMLLGGLFLLGDRLLGMLVVQDAGRYVAWTTYGRREFPDARKVFRYAEEKGVFEMKRFYSVNYRHTEAATSDGNNWGWGREAYATASSDRPLWTALVDVQKTTMSTGEEPTESKAEFHGEDSLFAPSFDYHRVSESVADSLGGDSVALRRSLPTVNLQETAIAFDSRFAREPTRGDKHGERTPYSRNPVLSALGE